MLTPRENLLQVLRRGSPEWKPCCFHVSNSRNIPGNLPAELLKTPLDRLAISKYMGGDLLYEIHPVKTVFADKINTKINGNVQETKTPIGALYTHRETTTVPPITQIKDKNTVSAGPAAMTTITRFPVQEKKDYEILQCLFENMRFELNDGEIEKAIAEVGDDGVVVIGGGTPSPLYSLIGNYTGLERFCCDLMDYPELLTETMELMEKKACEWYNAAIASKAQVIRGTDDLDVNLVSPEMFKKYSSPSVKKYAEICHKKDKIMIQHMCGNIKEFLPDIKETGVDAIHCLCPPPTGNTPIACAREILGNETAMMVRPDPPTLTAQTPEKVAKHVRQIMREAEEIPYFALIVPCGRAPLENLMTLKSVMQEQKNKKA